MREGARGNQVIVMVNSKNVKNIRHANVLRVKYIVAIAEKYSSFHVVVVC